MNIKQGTVIDSEEYPIAVGIRGEVLKNKSISILKMLFNDGTQGTCLCLADKGEAHPQTGEKIAYSEVKLKPHQYKTPIYDNPLTYNWSVVKLK